MLGEQQRTSLRSEVCENASASYHISHNRWHITVHAVLEA